MTKPQLLILLVIPATLVGPVGHSETRTRHRRKYRFFFHTRATGKTTLCKALVQRLDLKGPAVVKEVARHVMETRGFTRKDVGALEMQRAIMEAHLKEEQKRWSCPVQICDRSAIDPIVYAVLTSSDENEARRCREILMSAPDFKHALPIYRRSAFILLAPVADWLEDDGVRLLEHQSRCFEVFGRILVELGIPYLEIGEQMRYLEERVTMAMGLMRL